MFTGYAALTIAEVLPPGGRMVSLEIDPYLAEFTAPLFANSPHGHKIDVRLGPALQASILYLTELFHSDEPRQTTTRSAQDPPLSRPPPSGD